MSRLHVTIDVPDEELNGAKYLVVGRANEPRHGLVIFEAGDDLGAVTRSAHETAKQFPGKPLWLFRVDQEIRADIISEAKSVK